MAFLVQEVSLKITTARGHASTAIPGGIWMHRHQRTASKNRTDETWVWFCVFFFLSLSFMSCGMGVSSLTKGNVVLVRDRRAFRGRLS
jgi:hypothetical protein